LDRAHIEELLSFPGLGIAKAAQLKAAIDRVPFDLNTFKYVPITQAAEIPNKVKPEIVAILRDCGANI